MKIREEIGKEFYSFLNNKVFLIALGFILVCSYGFQITHFSVGIDDTAIPLYFDKGLSPVMGRWVIFLLNKIIYLTKFAPFLTELIGAVLLALTAVVYCVLFRRLIGESFDTYAAIVFSGVFVSYPLISFVYRYYLHNGLGIGNLATAIALLIVNESFSQNVKKRIKYCLISMIMLLVAIGCYESFIIVYLIGLLAIVFFRAAFAKEKQSFVKCMINLMSGCLTIAVSVLFRSVVIRIVVLMFKLSVPEVTTIGLRSLSEIKALFHPVYGESFGMLVKRFLIVYHLNALVFFPIAVYELSCLLLLAFSLVLTFKKKNCIFLLLWAGMEITPFLLVIIEAKVSFYRECQYLPLACALGMSLLYVLCKKIFSNKRIMLYLVGTALSIIIYNQVAMLNSNFYMEYQEYQYTLDTLKSVAHDIMEEYGNEYPVIFIGNNEMQHEFVKDYYVPFSDKRYQLLAKITDINDVHLKEKYWTPYGYCFLNEGSLSTIQWAFDAFDGTNREMIEFLRIHGYSFTYLTDPDEYKRIRYSTENADMPKWPLKGSIRLENGYVIVNL